VDASKSMPLSQSGMPWPCLASKLYAAGGVLDVQQTLARQDSKIGGLGLDMSTHGTLTEALPGDKHFSQL